jgi:hypothetical protein
MTWAQIWAAINNDMAMPLNLQLQTRASQASVDALLAGTPGRISVQRGFYVLGDTHNPGTIVRIPISTVNPANAFMLFEFSQRGTAGLAWTFGNRITLTANAIEITGAFDEQWSMPQFHWQVISQS